MIKHVPTALPLPQISPSRRRSLAFGVTAGSAGSLLCLATTFSTTQVGRSAGFCWVGLCWAGRHWLLFKPPLWLARDVLANRLFSFFFLSFSTDAAAFHARQLSKGKFRVSPISLLRHVNEPEVFVPANAGGMLVLVGR